MNSIAIIVVAALMLMTGRSASAADAKGVYVNLGEGNTTCGTWADERRVQEFYPEIGWVLGYFSAYNEYVYKRGKDIADGEDTSAIAAWIDNYCARNPLNKISDAVRRLLLVLIIKEAGGTATDQYAP